MITDMAYVVQPYTEGQEQQVGALLLSCGWQRNAIPSPEVLGEAALTGCAHVAIENNRVVGFVRVISDGELVSYVTELAVHVARRYHGVGRALIDAVAAEFPKARIDLLSTPLAQSFYEELGFVSKPGYRRWPK